MANKPKRKGTDAEVALVAYLRDLGYYAADRHAQRGNKDVGDISGVRSWCKRHGQAEPITIEVKSYANLATGIRVGLTQLDAEMAKAGTCYGLLIVKPKGVGLTSQGDWLAIRRLRNEPMLGGPS